MSKSWKSCAVAVCPNTDRPDRPPGISFHRFPRDKSTRKVWVIKCQRADKFNPKTSRVCSAHFSPEDFERDLRAELLKFVLNIVIQGPTDSERVKVKLKPKVVPSLNLKKQDYVSSSSVSRKERKLQKQHQEEHRWLIQSALSTPLVLDESSVMEIPEVQEQGPGDTNYRDLYFELLKEKKILQSQMEQQKEDLNHALEKLENIEEKSQLVLKKVFSENEIDVLMGKKQFVHWTTNEIADAFTIRYLSKRAYVYLREKRGFPFPGLSILKRWASKISLRHGILEDVLKMMEIAGSELSDMEKLCVLSFDEVKISETIEYDEHEDEVVGPFKQMQVAMARGLVASWKQPVFVDFDKKMSKDIIRELASKLHDIGYIIVALVSDCGGGNIGLWGELSLTIEKPYFPHPINGNPIVYLPDAPHLLKLLRNWLLDTGFIFSDGSIINKTPLIELQKLTSSEISVCPKLKESHLTCVGAQRQNVSLAAQLMSNTVGTALVHYLPGNDKKIAEDTGNFLLLINQWFDLMNTFTTQISTIAHKSPYGQQLEEQNEILNKVFITVENMRCANKNKLQLFQKGLMMSCKAVPILYDNVSKLGVKYIMTHKLNQDCLENFFSQIRAKGGLHDHPAPLNALHKMRLILMGKNPGLVQSTSNVMISTTDENFVTNQVLKQAQVSPTLPEEVYSDFQLPEITSDSESTSTSSSETNMNLETDTTRDGLTYIAGWIAFKFKDKYPELKTPTEEDKGLDHNYAIPPWIKHLSFGGLTNPDPEFCNKVFKMEKKICSLAKKEGFLKTKKIVQKLCVIMGKKMNDGLPKEVVRKFVKLRLIIG